MSVYIKIKNNNVGLSPFEFYVNKGEGLSLLARGNTTILPLPSPVIYFYQECLSSTPHTKLLGLIKVAGIDNLVRIF